jgi:hypothetical protein
VVAALHGVTVVLVAIGCFVSTGRVTLGGAVYSPGDIVDLAGDPPSDRTLDHLMLPAYAWADEIPKNSRVGVHPEDISTLFGFPWIYQLFGVDFRNDVVALDKRDVRPESLVSNLRRRHVDYLVTYPDTVARTVAQQHPEVFMLVSNRNEVAVYRVNREAVPAPP